MGSEAEPTGPDLASGVPVAEVPDGGTLAGHVGKKSVLLVRQGTEWFAVGAVCSHYSGPLPEGLIVGDTGPHTHSQLGQTEEAPTGSVGASRMSSVLDVSSADQSGRTFSAWGPLGPCVTSNSTFWFSSSDL